MKVKNVLLFTMRLLVAVILIQTLFFKFTGHEESVILFTKLGVEPFGRILTGVLELIVSMLILWRPTVLMGALLGMGIMMGAIASHLFLIGIESAGDGGQLFILACLVFLLCAILAVAYNKDGKKWLTGLIRNKLK